MHQPLVIGKLRLKSNIIHSPLAGCSDVAYRTMVRRFDADTLVYCEMVKMEALVRGDKTTLSLLSYTAQMHPIGAQLCGSRPDLAGPCAKILENLGFDCIDLNCGCPVDKVTKDGSGSGLLKTPDKIGEIISNMKAAVSIPVTVKIRMGWDETSIFPDKIVRLAEEAGADAVAIHGRTRAAGYRGPAQRGPIRDGVLAATNIPVIGNGDVFDIESADGLFQETGCAGILIARGGMGAPWLSRQITSFYEKKPFTPPDPLDVLREHIDCIFETENEKKALLDIRRVGSWYLKNTKESRQMRHQISRLSSRAELNRLLPAN